MFHKMSVGAKLVALDKFNPEVFLQTLEKHKTNVLFAAPPIGKDTDWFFKYLLPHDVSSPVL